MKVYISLSNDRYDANAKRMKQDKSNLLFLARQLRSAGYKKVKTHPPKHEEDGSVSFDVSGYPKDTFDITLTSTSRWYLSKRLSNGKIKMHPERLSWEDVIADIPPEI